MCWRVAGADKVTGKDRIVRVIAPSAEEAERLALEHGIYVSRVWQEKVHLIPARAATPAGRESMQQVDTPEVQSPPPAQDAVRTGQRAEFAAKNVASTADAADAAELLAHMVCERPLLPRLM